MASPPAGPKSKYAWLEKGTTRVKWLDAPTDKKFTHGTFLAFGYSTRRAWVQRKRDGVSRFVPTNMLLRGR